MAINNALLAFPGILLALGLLAVFGANQYGIILALGIAYTPSMARVVRGAVLSLREREFVEASKVMGNSEALHDAAPYPAELPGADHRAGDVDVRLGDPVGKRPELPRPWRAATGADLGQHARRRPAVHRAGRLARSSSPASASR